MADVTKYAPINGGGTLITYMRRHFQMFKTKKTVAFASYGFMFAFIAFTIFLAFSPSTNSSSPWFTNIFSTISSSSSSSGNSSSSYGSNHSSNSIYSYFFTNSTTEQVHSNSITDTSEASKNSTTQQPNLDKGSSNFKNQTQTDEFVDKGGILKPNQTVNVNTTAQFSTSSSSSLNKDSSDFKNQTQIDELVDKGGILKPNQTVNVNTTAQSSSQLNKGSSDFKNQTKSKDLHNKDEILKTNQSSKGAENSTDNGGKGISEKGIVKNLTSSLVRNQSNGSNSGGSGIDILVKSLMGCEFFDGNWVKDDSYPLYEPGSCSLIDEQFNCFINGRPDNVYHKMKWKPKGCTLPRLDGSHMLDMLRGKRLVFVGDSLNRNMWESLICILKNSVKDQKRVYEASGRHHFRAEASYSFVFQDYNCTVEFFVSPFLVREWEVKDKIGKKKETLRLDMVGETAERYKTADIIVFNTGHWWTHEKTSLGKDYYQEGSHVYSDLNVLEAFRKALTTWGRWVDAHINPTNTLVFFRGYSVSHFSGGQWNSGGACDHETEPIKNETFLAHYLDKMVVLERVLKGMKTPVSYLNITRLTDYRKDGHPSIYRKKSYSAEEKRSPLRFQDCSHWCLPGVPDAWNELLYAELLVNQYKKQQQQQQQKRP